MYNGIINVYKEKGFTSFDVVAKLRGILHQKKIGHTGTLDPDACGVLPVCLGSGTKLCDLLTDKDKIYEATMLLGTKTDTLDTSGTVIKTRSVNVTEDEIVQVINSFIGEIFQIPPMYSAIKVNGKKLYELARQGKNVERQKRKVTIFDITISEISIPYVKFRVHCSKGTYIRTLCDDIGEKLGCLACMSDLMRVKSGNFDISKSHTLSEIEELVKNDKFQEIITNVDEVFLNYPSYVDDGSLEKLLINGNKFRINKNLGNSIIRVYLKDNTFIGLYKYNDAQKMYIPVKVFLSGN